MPLRKETVNIQQDLARFCIKETGYIPGAEKERLKTYPRLIKNVILDTLETAFPIFVSGLEEESKQLFDLFIQTHSCQTSQIWKLPEEFVEFVKKRKLGNQLQKPFLDDLLYFEWLETKIFTMEDIPAVSTPEGNFLSTPLIVNPENELVRFTYPVHLIGVNNLTESKGTYFLFGYRFPETGQVQFLSLSPLHTWLLEQWQEQKCNTEILLMAEEIMGNQPAKLLNEHLPELVAKFLSDRVLLGYQKI